MTILCCYFMILIYILEIKIKNKCSYIYKTQIVKVIFLNHKLQLMFLCNYFYINYPIIVQDALRSQQIKCGQ